MVSVVVLVAMVLAVDFFFSVYFLRLSVFVCFKLAFFFLCLLVFLIASFFFAVLLPC